MNQKFSKIEKNECGQIGPRVARSSASLGLGQMISATCSLFSLSATGLSAATFVYVEVTTALTITSLPPSATGGGPKATLLTRLRESVEVSYRSATLQSPFCVSGTVLAAPAKPVVRAIHRRGP